MTRQDAQTPHEKSWNFVHPAIARFLGNFYTWRDTQSRQNYIGANAQAFETLMLPLLLPKGPGEVVWKQLIAMTPPVYITQVVKPTGLPGIAAGQIWNGGLTDNPNMADNLAGEIV